MASNSISLVTRGEALEISEDLIGDSRFRAAVSASLRKAVVIQDTRGAAQQTLEVGDEDILQLDLEDGLVLYTSGARFQEQFLSDSLARGDAGPIQIPTRVGVEASRGLTGILLKRIGIVDVETAAAETVADLIKDKIESAIAGDSDALYPVAQLRQVETLGDGRLQPQAPEAFDRDQPILLFLHGTASSTRGSFAGLWSEGGDQVWQQICAGYPSENIVGFEHHTLSLSPIENVINLLQCLPRGARLHLVSHSRGGIVGELLCRGQMADGRVPFSEQDLDFFSREKNRGLQSLIDSIVAANAGRGEQDPYARQRQQLIELNGLLREKAIIVERFVRVACPARGTTLASNRLDMYLSTMLNIIGLIPVLKAGPIYAMVKSLLLAVVKQKSRAEQIPGLEAQMPGSPTMRMLNSTQGSSLAPLTVIEGDIEPRGIFGKIALLLVDRFYRGDHDLVVNTPSMDGGTLRRFGIYARSFSGEKVNHFSYFSNGDSRAALQSGLRDPRPAGYVERTQVPRVIARSLPPGRARGEVPAVFIVPGILGSELAVGDDQVWVDKLGLIWGGFGKLKIDNQDVMAVKPLALSYGALAAFLSESHEVIPFAYDWRRSIARAADRLNEEVGKYLADSRQPLRFIAHSMGGLVVRSLIARHPRTWDAICRRQGSRVLMLGTPNDGSHSMVRMLLGQERLIKYLALLDLEHSHNELIDIVRRFPGVLELLPRESDRAPEEGRRFFDSGFWNGCESLFGKGWSAPAARDLRRAAQFWHEIESTPLDTQRVFYLAGQAAETPADVVLESGRVSIRSTARGDGRVPWDGGIPKGIQHWFLDVEHGELANHPPSFRGMLEIIDTGGTLAFSGRPPVVTRGLDQYREMAADSVDFLPDEEDLMRAAVGSTGAGKSAATGLPALDVSVLHGDLRFVDLPVAVGHYLGDEIVSAESVLDHQLQGKLHQRYQLGLYPGAAGTHEVVIERTERGLSGAIVIGLGDIGGLTPGTLTASLRGAVTDYALKITEEQAVPESGMEFACLLIGSGAGGITMENVLNSIVQGVLEANEKLAGDTRNVDRLIQGIRFVELFEDRAALAQHLLNRLAGNARYEHRIRAEQRLRRIEGGRRRAYALEQEGWWPRIRIEKGEHGSLGFTVIDQGARVPMVITQTQRCSVDPFLRDAADSINMDDQVGRVLFELLIPPEFKHHAPERRDLVLVVDEQSAVYPWELLEYPTPEGNRALASEASVIRQLAVPGANRGAAATKGKLVVVADPEITGTGFPQLQGAEREGEAVVSMFGEGRLAQRFSPVRLVKRRGTDILRVLMTEQIRILHISAHGVVRHPVRCAGEDQTEVLTGVLIGRDHILSAAEINQMPSVPQLAFINCCHLGRVDGAPRTTPDRPNLLAADFGVSLIQHGVRAVVVAGWAVQDAAAEVFARTFYTQMLAGHNFGQAVKEARVRTQGAYPQFNTWGAYQCYGDPGFRLVEQEQGGAQLPREDLFVSLEHCCVEIDNIAAEARTTSNPGPLVLKLQSIIEPLPPEWADDARLQIALGRAWGELREFSRAIQTLEAGCTGEEPAATIQDLEQLANFRVRHAMVLADRGDTAQARQLHAQAVASLKRLNELFGQTVERMNLLGGAYKRRALLSGPATRARVKALQTACHCYAQANELSMVRRNGKPYHYPVLNLLALRHLLRYYRAEYKLEAGQVEGWLGSLAQHYDPDLEVSRESFWSAIAGNELLFTERLLSDTLDRQAVKRIASRYLEIRRQAASPRQFSSIVEQLGFLLRLADEAPVTAAKGGKQDLEASRERLTRAIEKLIRDLSA